MKISDGYLNWDGLNRKTNYLAQLKTRKSYRKWKSYVKVVIFSLQKLSENKLAQPDQGAKTKIRSGIGFHQSLNSL